MPHLNYIIASKETFMSDPNPDELHSPGGGPPQRLSPMTRNFSRATISRKEKDATVLSKDESERLLGVETLVGMVQNMVEQSGDPTGFDAARWVSE